MSYEQRDNSGSLFKNEDKLNEGSADYTGSIKVDGKDFWLNAWLRTAKSGRKFMSLSVQPKQQKAEKPREVPVKQEIDFDDPIGF